MATVSLTPRMIRKLAVDRPALAKALAAQDQVKVENAEDMQTAFVRFPLQHSALSANAQAECTAVEGTGEASIVIDSCWEKFFEPSAPQGGYQAGDLVLLDGQPAVVLRELRMLSLMPNDPGMGERLISIEEQKKRLVFVSRPSAEV